MIGSKVSASSSTIDSDFDLVCANSMINTLKSKKCIDSPCNKENFLTSKSKASSSQNNPKKLPTQLNKETNSKDNAVLLQKLKQAKKALAKYQEDKNRLESELTQNRSLMAQILSCQITAKNKTRVKNSSRPKEYFPSDDRCVGIKTFDSLAWIPLLERLEEEQVDLFVQVPPPMIPRLLDGKGGLISQTVFKSLISLTVNEHQNSSIATPPFCIILLPFSHVVTRYLTYLKDEPVNVLFTRDGLFNMDYINKSLFYPTFCLTTCNHFLIELDNGNDKLNNLTLLLLDEADLLIHDVDFVRCFIEIQSLSVSSYRTLMFSRTLDNQTSPLLSDILKIGYKTLLIGERAFEMSHSSLNYSEQSEGRLIDFDEESSVSENELNQTRHSNELVEQQQGDYENIDDVANLTTLNDEEQDDIIVSNSELSQPSETNELSENVEEQNLISNKDAWPLEFINIRPPPPPAMLPFYMENDEEINFNEQGTSYQIYNNIENDQQKYGQSSFFEIEEQNVQRNGLLIDFDQRQSTSTLGEAYQSCLASFKSTSTHTSISNLSSFTNANVFSRHNQMLNNSSTRQLQVKRYRARSYGKAKIGKLAPEFTTDAVVDSDFKTVSLSDYKGKYVVLFFYPLDFTFVCPTEIIAFSERSGDFTKINVQLLACSTDSKFSHFEWINKPRKEGGLGEMKIPVLSDRNMKIARDYGVLKEDEGIAYRGLFIIDPKGILRQITINDLPVGRSVDETLRLVQAFQYTDKHGEVCPANWKPGSDTIKPDPNKSKEYFGKQ
uniref:thioredoxin-dependent peroxiredoxin n=1 Tax=Meloidogyne javanica TaxID=6303 RepID=A0A915M8D9_MELJA